MHKVACHRQHAANPFGKHMNLFLCLADVKFRGAEDTGRYEFELEFVIALMLGGHEELNDFDIDVRQPYHDAQVDEVEHRVEY